MADDKNPSVVKTEDGGNQTISRDIYKGGLNQVDIGYFDDLSKAYSSPSPGALSTDQYYPTANRGIQVGSIGSKTLGSLPIFAAGKGLLPIGILEAKKKAEQDALIQKMVAMGGDSTTELFNKYLDLGNPWLNDDFNYSYQKELDDAYQVFLKEAKGSHMQARAMFRASGIGQKIGAKYNNFGTAYKQVYGNAMKYLASANDPNTYVPDEIQRDAANFMKSMDEIDTTNIDALTTKLRDFTIKSSAYSLVETKVKSIAEQSYASIKEDTELSTPANKYNVLTTSINLGYNSAWRKTTIDEMVKGRPEFDNPDTRALMDRLLQDMIPKSVERSGKAVLRDRTTRRTVKDITFGLITDDVTGRVTGDRHTVRIPYTNNEYDTQVMSVPQKNSFKQVPNIEILPDQRCLISYGGKNHVGHFTEGFSYKPTAAYVDHTNTMVLTGRGFAASDFVQMGTTGAMSKATGPRTFITEGIDEQSQEFTLTEKMLGASLQITVLERDVRGQMDQQFGNGIWTDGVDDLYNSIMADGGTKIRLGKGTTYYIRESDARAEKLTNRGGGLRSTAKSNKLNSMNAKIKKEDKGGKIYTDIKVIPDDEWASMGIYYEGADISSTKVQSEILSVWTEGATQEEKEAAKVKAPNGTIYTVKELHDNFASYNVMTIDEIYNQVIQKNK